MGRTADLRQSIERALAAHHAWCKRMRHFVETDTLPKTASDIARDDQCALGIWLNQASKDPYIQSAPCFEKVKADHTRFHLSAGQVAALVEQGNIPAALERLESPDYAGLSDELSRGLTDMRIFLAG